MKTMRLHILVMIMSLYVVGCRNTKLDTSLQCFKLNNTELDSLMIIYTNQTFLSNCKIQTERDKLIPIMILQNNDSTIELIFTYRERYKISYFISRENYRILGYCNDNYKEDLVLLVDCNSSKLENLGRFYSLVLPTQKVKNIDYLFDQRVEYKYTYSKENKNYQNIPFYWEEYPMFHFFYKTGMLYFNGKTFPLLPKGIQSR